MEPKTHLGESLATHCQCLYEIHNNLPRTIFCFMPCNAQKTERKKNRNPDLSPIENKFKIANFRLNEDNSFTLTHYDEYLITYLSGSKAHNFRVVVNGRFTTKKEINIVNQRQGYKNILLEAVSNYKKGLFLNDNVVANTCSSKITMAKLRVLYSKGVVNIVKNTLLAIHVEKERDTLTKFDLI